MAPAGTSGGAKRKHVEEDHLADAGLEVDRRERRIKKQHRHTSEKVRDVTDLTAGGKSKVPEQGGLRAGRARSPTSPAAPSKMDGAVAEEEQGHEDAEPGKENLHASMASPAKERKLEAARAAETTDAWFVTDSTVESEAGTGESSAAVASSQLLDPGLDSSTTQVHVKGYMEAVASDEQIKALESLILLPTWNLDLPITIHTPKYGWVRLQGWPNWTTFYSNIDLQDISSVGVMMQRFDLLLEDLSAIEEDEEFFGELPVPYAQISSIREKMVYEKGQLNKQQRFLNEREGATPVSPLPSDLVDTQDPPFDISFYEAGSIPLVERKKMGKAFPLRTIHGAQQALEWMSAQIDILSKSPLHYQPATPYRYQKSAFLEAVEKLKSLLLELVDKLKEEAARAGANVRTV